MFRDLLSLHTMESKVGRKVYVSLILLIVAFMVVSVTFIVLYVEEKDSNDLTTPAPTPTRTAASGVCQTPECLLQAAAVASSMNRAVGPCDNFYEFACGNWVLSHPAPSSTLRWSPMDILTRDLDAALHEILNEGTNTSAVSTATEKAKTYYKLCTNETALEDPRNFQGLLRHVGEIFPEFSDFSFTSVPSVDATAQALIRARRYGISPIVLAGMGFNENVPGEFMIQFRQPTFGPQIDIYTKADVSTELQLYRELIRDFLLLFARKGNFSLSSEKATELAEQFADFERTLFQRRKTELEMRSREQRRAPPQNLMTLRSVADVYTSKIGLDTENLVKFFTEGWTNADASAKLTPDTVVNVQSIAYYQAVASGLGERVQTPSGRAFYAYYVLFQVAYSYVDRLDRDFRAITQKYLAVHGLTAWKSRADICVKTVNAELSDSVGYLYVQRHFRPAAKLELEKMVGYLSSSLKRLILDADWMTDTTKAKALTKADLFHVQIGYPDYFDDNLGILDDVYSEFNVSSGSYFEATLTYQKSDAKQEGKLFLNGLGKDMWISGSAVINAYFQANLAALIFPAAFLQPPFMSENYFDYWNYGAIGMVIGHEMTHAFDDNGAQYDGNGQMLNWWDEQSARGFQERLRGLLLQYSNFSLMDVPHNPRTLGEDVADNGGLKEAFYAYQNFVSKERDRFPEPVLPNLGFNSEQLFFLSNAQVWCATYTQQGVQTYTDQDEHSLSPYRVNGPMQNFQEFSKAFNCPAGSYMNPRVKQGVW